MAISLPFSSPFISHPLEVPRVPSAAIATIPTVPVRTVRATPELTSASASVR